MTQQTQITPTIRPTEKQALVWDLLMDDEHLFILFGGAAGGGKSWLYCEWLLVLAYSAPGSRGFIARNELKRIMNSTYVTFQKVCKYHGIPDTDWKLDGKYNVIRFKNGSTIDLLDVAFSPADPEYNRLGSTEYSHGFGEEAGEWEFTAFDVLKSRIGRHKVFAPDGTDITPPSKFGMSCNPSKNFLYRIFYKPWKEKKLAKEYAYIHALYSDNPYTAKEYGDQLKLIADDRLREKLMNGNWEYEEGTGEIMKYQHIVDMFTNVVDDGEGYMSVDVARYGSDLAVINIWRGLKSILRVTYKKSSMLYLEDEVKRLAAEYRIPFSRIVVDDDGVGGSLPDHLPGVKRFVGASTPIMTRSAMRRQLMPNARTGMMERTTFANLKAQCAFKLAELVETHAIAATSGQDTDKIIEEMSVVKQKDFDKEVKLKIVSKDEMKDVLGRSPDFADTFIMRMVFELLKDMRGQNDAGASSGKQFGTGMHPALRPRTGVGTRAF